MTSALLRSIVSLFVLWPDISYYCALIFFPEINGSAEYGAGTRGREGFTGGLNGVASIPIIFLSCNYLRKVKLE
jgi:hypothetical protein